MPFAAQKVAMDEATRRQTCPDCSVTFARRAHLYRHQRSKHGGIKSFPCEKCLRHFRVESDLTQHEIAQHPTTNSSTRPSKRPAAAAVRPSVRKHVDRRTATTAIVKQKRRSKKKTKTLEKNVCEECGDAFSSRLERIAHSQRAHAEQRAHVCEKCEWRFATRAMLVRHDRFIHEEERAFECDKCGKRFFDRSGVRRHEDAVHGKGA